MAKSNKTTDTVQQTAEMTLPAPKSTPSISWAIYKIDRRIEEAIERAVNPETGEIDEIASAELEKLYNQRDELICDVVHYYKHATGFADAIDAEIKRLQDRKKFVQNAANRIKQFLSKIIPAGEKVKAETYEIGWRKSTEVYDISLDYTELEQHFPDLLRIKVVKELDKNAVKALHKEAGFLPMGIEIIEKNNIQIK